MDFKSAQEHLQKVLNAKEQVRIAATKLSYIEKIKRVIEMQKFASEFKKDKSKKIYVWEL